MSDTTHYSRLYLVIPHDADSSTLEAFGAALESGHVASALLRAGDDGTVDRQLAGKLLAMTLDHDTVLLIDSDIDVVEAVGADGVQIPGDEELYAQVRAALGPDAIIGVACAPERHTSLSLAERGADYIAFGGSATTAAERNDMISWWAEIVEVPVVACAAASIEEAAELARLGADFVCVDESVWSTGADTATVIGDLARALGTQRSAA